MKISLHGLAFALLFYACAVVASVAIYELRAGRCSPASVGLALALCAIAVPFGTWAFLVGIGRLPAPEEWA